MIHETYLIELRLESCECATMYTCSNKKVVSAITAIIVIANIYSVLSRF